MAELQVLDVETARIVEQVCDAIVPGSARVQPAVYVDALLARMDDGRAALAAAFTSLGGRGSLHASEHRLPLRARRDRGVLRDSWRPVSCHRRVGEIDFNSPLATRLAKDWSYLGIG